MPLGGRLDGPMRVRMLFLFPRPLRLRRQRDKARPVIPHVGRPDWDNLVKSTQDALLRWWHDDKQVCVGEAAKLYAPHDHIQGMYWVIWTTAGKHPRRTDSSVRLLIDSISGVWESLTHERR